MKETFLAAYRYCILIFLARRFVSVRNSSVVDKYPRVTKVLHSRLDCGWTNDGYITLWMNMEFIKSTWFDADEHTLSARHSITILIRSSEDCGDSKFR